MLQMATIIEAILLAKAELPNCEEYQDGVRATAENVAEKLPEQDHDAFLLACGFTP